MSRKAGTQQAQVQVTARISKELYDRLVAECGHCGCAMNSIVRNAIASEIHRRRLNRKQAADHAILAGQIDVEGNVHA